MAKTETRDVPATQEPAKQGELQISNYQSLQLAPIKMQTIIRENIGTAGLKVFDLDRIRIPSGGGRVWELPSLKGPEAVSTFEAIILARRDVRSYWKAAYGSTNGGGNQPPDCSSPDAINGFGHPGGACRTCPLSGFGTATKQDGKTGRGQACRQAIMLLLLRPQDLLPVVLIVPPGSLKDTNQFFLRLTQIQRSVRQVVLKFGLKQEKNADGITFSKVTLELVREMNQDEFSRAASLADSLTGFFTEQTLRREDVAGA